MSQKFTMSQKKDTMNVMDYFKKMLNTKTQPPHPQKAPKKALPTKHQHSPQNPFKIQPHQKQDPHHPPTPNPPHRPTEPKKKRTPKTPPPIKQPNNKSVPFLSKIETYYVIIRYT